MQAKRIDVLPVKIKKLKVRKRYFNYLVIDDQQGATIIRQRKGKDIWQNLFEFPLHESKNVLLEETEMEDIISEEFPTLKSYTFKRFNQEPIVHKLTHQTLFASFWIIQTEGRTINHITWEDLKNIALPVLLQNFVDKYQGPYE